MRWLEFASSPLSLQGTCLACVHRNPDGQEVVKMKSVQKRKLIGVSFCAIGLLSAIAASASYIPQLYGVSEDGKLSIFLPAAGVVDVGELFPGAGVTPVVSAMAVSPSVGPYRVFVWLNAGSGGDDNGRLLTLFPSTGVAIPVEPAADPQGSLEALAISSSGILYGLDDILWSVDINTGAKTLIGSLGGFEVLAADFAPGGTLYGVTADDKLVTIDTNSGSSAVVAPLSVEIGTVGSIAFTGAENAGLVGSGSNGPLGNILFSIDVTNGTVSNIQTLGGVAAPKGMSFVLDYHLCDVADEPIQGSISTWSNCGDGSTGRLMTKWLPFGEAEVLEADSGEKLELLCDNGFSYGLYYTPRPEPLGSGGSSSWRVGVCPFGQGCNRGSFFYSGDRNENGKPDCLVRTRWISKDYGSNDLPNPWTKEQTENPPLLDWAESVMTVDSLCIFNCTGGLEKISHKFQYKVGPPVIGCSSGYAEGALEGRTAVVDPPVGPGTEQFFDDVLLQVSPEAEPMKWDPSAACDADGDGDCDRSDYDFFRAASGTCRGDMGYHPAADLNADGCVGLADRRYVFSGLLVDLKPGSDPNCVKTSSRGTVSVAVLTTEDFDATTVDPSSGDFGGAQPWRWSMQDIDWDGDHDLVLKFKTREVAEWPAEGTDCDLVILTAQTFDGTAVAGADLACLPGEGTCEAADDF
jgi:hypothetical protein